MQSIVINTALLVVALAGQGTRVARADPGPPTAVGAENLIAHGRQLFLSETFDGNGRTCASCHPLDNEFTLDPSFIATRPGSAPLFVAELSPALTDLEVPSLMRGPRALILENIDGFDAVPMFRGTPHIFNLARTAPYGLSGDVPDLKAFSLGAIRQHFPKTLERREGVDFRLPTAEELDALEAFQLSIATPGLNLDGLFDHDRFVRTIAQQRGFELFFGAAKCSECHSGEVLADASAARGGGNQSFDTGVAKLLLNEETPPDPPIGVREGAREFSTPTLLEVNNTAPYFHDNSVTTLREAVAFYDGVKFNQSPAGGLVGGIQLAAAQIDDLTAFLAGLTTCGDGTVDPGEQCDSGPNNGVDHCCSMTCRLVDVDSDGHCDGCPHVSSPATAMAGGSVLIGYGPGGAGSRDDTMKIRGMIGVPSATLDPVQNHNVHVTLRTISGEERLLGQLPSGPNWVATGVPPARWRYWDPSKGTSLGNVRANLKLRPSLTVAALRLRAQSVDVAGPRVGEGGDDLLLSVEIEAGGQGTCTIANLHCEQFGASLDRCKVK